MPISCHFRDCKALLGTNLTHVSGAIASVQTFTFIFATLEALNRHLCAAVHRNAAIFKLVRALTISCIRQNFMTISQTVHDLSCWQKNKSDKRTSLKTIHLATLSLKTHYLQQYMVSHNVSLNKADLWTRFRLSTVSVTLSYLRDVLDESTRIPRFGERCCSRRTQLTFSETSVQHQHKEHLCYNDNQLCTNCRANRVYWPYWAYLKGN